MAKKKKVMKKKVVIVEEDKGAKVENEDAFRDPNSGAIVFNNQTAYQQAVRRKRQNVTNNKNNGEIKSLQKQVAQLSALVNDLINSSKK